jgi:hypothetical protein
VVLFTVTLFLASAQAGNIKTIASTIPGNGDVNPYGVAVVPTTTGSLTQGNILVSNFNNSANLQGTGTTIVQISPSGTVSLFAQINANSLPGPCPGGIGLTTALVALKTGWVVVGSLPTTDGTSATAQAGCLLVLDSKGNVETFYGSLINGPWDMTAADRGNKVALFVTNVLNGTLAGSGKCCEPGNSPEAKSHHCKRIDAQLAVDDNCWFRVFRENRPCGTGDWPDWRRSRSQ